MSKRKSSHGLSDDDVSAFELIQGKLQGLYDEVLTLSKKSPTDAFNKFKIGIANRLLAEANDFLGRVGTSSPIEGFERFVEDDIPANSDVVIVLSQYLKCFELLRGDNVKHDFDDRWVWIVDGRQSQRRTAAPAKLKER